MVEFKQNTQNPLTNYSISPAIFVKTYKIEFTLKVSVRKIIVYAMIFFPINFDGFS